MRRIAAALSVALVAAVLVVAPNAQAAGPTHGALLFAAEFNDTAGTLPDPAQWGYEGPTVHRNNELQTYQVADVDNSSTDGAGNMRISVRKESPGYTSAMLISKGKFEFVTGCIVARIKTPSGSGAWPAFWTEGSTGSWPAHGEVDVMEEINTDAWTNVNVHGGPNHWSKYKGYASVRNAWHTYEACITATDVTFYFDGTLRHTVLKSGIPSGQVWPFGTVSQFIRLNVAMGGDWPGKPNGTAPNPLVMLVDYVRVYALPGAAPVTTTTAVPTSTAPTTAPTTAATTTPACG